MAIDPSRLYSVLLNTGLQTKNNPLYQVLYNLISQLSQLNTTVTSGSGGSPSTTITNNISQVIAMLGGKSETTSNYYVINQGSNSSGANTYDSPLTNGDSGSPELIWDSFGDVVMVTGIPL